MRSHRFIDTGHVIQPGAPGPNEAFVSMEHVCSCQIYTHFGRLLEELEGETISSSAAGRFMGPGAS